MDLAELPKIQQIKSSVKKQLPQIVSVADWALSEHLL